MASSTGGSFMDTTNRSVDMASVATSDSTVGLVNDASGSTVGTVATWSRSISDTTTTWLENLARSELVTDWVGGVGEDNDGFCRSMLWDSNLTWNTDNPDFTPCFHVTVLTYLPAAILLLGLPFQAYLSYTSRNRLTPWGIRNVTKMMLTLVLVLISVVDLVILLSDDDNSVSSSQLVAEGVRIFAYSLALLLQIICRYRGEVTSGPLFLFWLSAVICGAPTIRSVVQSPYLTGSQQVTPAITFTSQYVLVVLIFLLSFFSDDKPKYIDLETQAENLTPEVFASFPSKMGFFWYDSFAWVGWKRLFTRDDLWSLPLENRCRGLVPLWDWYWGKAVQQAAKTKKQLSILPILVRCFGKDVFWCGVMTLIVSLLQFVSPAVVDLIIGFVESDEPMWRGYLYIVTITGSTFFSILLNAQNYYLQWLIGLRIRTVITSALYRKSLKLSNTARREMTVGETTNLMAVDTQKFMDFALYVNMVWSSPLQIILCMYFLWGILGPASTAGLAVMVLMIPLNSFVANKMKKYQKAQMVSKDKRVKLMDEVLNGIKVLKLYAWEPSFSYKLLRIREEEIKALKKASYLSAFTTFLWTCAPFLVAVSSFTAYILIDESNVLDAQTAFVSMTYFNLLRMPLNMLPQMIVLLVQCSVSLRRVNKFMNADELDPTNVTRDEGFDWPVFAEQASYTWGTGKEQDTSPTTLHNISLRVKEGSLVAVVGQVGCGKSSLLSALLGDMKRTRGVANVCGRVAYVAQQAWIQNNTLRDNITFGKRFNAELYNKVVEACALVPDLQILPAGDQTEIGEKGINLSGGQKQRVSLARAVYSNGSVYLLDDPLSAVDAHVGKHIFDKVIGPKGLLKNKTRIIVTHGLSFLQQMDQIIVMQAGTITKVGSYQQLLDQKDEFAHFLAQHLVEEEDRESISSFCSSVSGKPQDPREDLAHSSWKHQQRRNSLEQPSSKSDLQTGHQQSRDQPARPVQQGQTIIETEQAKVGTVGWSVYSYYAKNIGLSATAVSLVFLLVYQGFSVGSNLWLSAWTDESNRSMEPSQRNKYLGVYASLGFLESISVVIATTVITIFTLTAAIKMHQSMLEHVLHAPMSFFDTTPLGRILNRFAKDIDVVDNAMPQGLRRTLKQLFNTFGTFVAIIIAMPLFIIIFIPIAFIFFFLQQFFMTTVRQLKRMEAISRSPIFSHFSETITGNSTIRAFDRVESFIMESESLMDENQVCYYPIVVANQWLSVRLDLIGNLVTLFASLYAVISRGSIQSGLVGMALTYALEVTNSLNTLLRVGTEVETNMVSVERIQEYQEIVQEAPFDIPENDPGEEWPEHGEIVFDNYQTRYREGLDLVLKGVSCRILSGEKIGIVGRTGAGKSSLTLALFRIIEAAGGSISIDGVNIAQLGLGRLRSRITIIPQDPVLFAGTLRMNLDPFEQYSDRNVWRALEQAHLKTTVANFPAGLNYEITEGGENLSVGQRQLVCLARALLRKTKVLVLDEATAAVDLETDDLVQATIRKEFLECTVLTIAHRLNTIMDSNRVMVLDQGRIVEMASPQELLANKDSIFYSMAKNAGIADN